MRPRILGFLLEHGAQVDIDSIAKILNFDISVREWYFIFEQGCLITIAEALLMYVVKWQAEGNFVTKLDSQAISKNSSLKIYYEWYKNEMERIKQKEFDSTNFSLFDILKSNTLDQLTRYAKISEISDYSRTKEFRREFPVYADLIITQFKKGMERKLLL